MDSTMQITYEGQDGTVGAAYSWVGQISGAGRISCASMTPEKDFHFNLDFSKPFESHPKGAFLFADAPEGTEVTWVMEGKNGFVEKVFSWFMNMDKMVGKDFENGLASIKSITESQVSNALSSKMEVKEINMSEATYIIKREMVLMDSIGSFFMKEMPAIDAYVQGNGMKMKGYPSGFYYKWDMSKMQTDMAVAMPVESAQNVKAPYKTEKVEAGKALVVDYYGPYENSQSAYDLLNAYCASNKLEARFAFIEEYVGDPMLAKEDMSDLLTRIYLPIK